jgi:outer membrane protein assembly factor BamD
MKKILLLAILAGMFMQCSKFARIQKSDNVAYKYKEALNYYENKKYYKAGLLFEEVMPLLKGQAEGANAEYYLAYCQYYQGNFILSAYYFKKFSESYRKNEKAEEAYYMYCMSLYEDSPDYELDQTNTLTALQAFQEYLTQFVDNKHVEDCNKYIDILTQKLETKLFMQAKQYYKMGDYKAAAVTFENVTKDFPSSRYVEECLYLKFVSLYEYANISIDSKRKERYEQAEQAYYVFIDKYPNSKYLKNAEDTYSKLQQKVSQLDKTNQNKKGLFFRWFSKT